MRNASQTVFTNRHDDSVNTPVKRARKKSSQVLTETIIRNSSLYEFEKMLQEQSQKTLNLAHEQIEP